MGNQIIIYREKLKFNIEESFKHLSRLDTSFNELSKYIDFPINKNAMLKIINNNQLIAYSDQAIYRFSKLQDIMGAKLFKSLLLYQGENINKPFLDILNQLEKINIINVDNWFEMRDLRNEIAHNYDNNDEISMNILNSIYKIKLNLSNILHAISQLANN